MSNVNINASTAANNPLCVRLQKKFGGRGVAAANIQNAKTVRIPRQTSETVRKMQRAADPFEQNAAFAAAGAKVQSTARFYTAKTSARSQSTAGVRTEAARAKAMSAESARTAEQAKRRCAAYEMTTPFKSGAYAAAYKRAADIRARAYDGSEAKAAAARYSAAAKKAPRALSPAWFKSLRAEARSTAADEKKIDTPPISKGVIIAIVLFAMVVMMIIFSFAQISEFRKEISGLENKKTELCEQIEQLSLDIDLKNDVRTIEQTATEDIGMVKSNQVPSKYISVGGGERIEVVKSDSDGTDKDMGVFSTLMSAVSSNWDKLLDYIN